MCPKADDPVTDNQNYREILLTVGGPSGFTGTLGLTFQGETTLLPLASMTDSTCESLLEAAEKFGDITCDYTAVSATQHTFLLTFVTWPLTPKENNLYTHDGNPATTDFMCDISSMSSSTVTCAFTDVSASNLRGKQEKVNVNGDYYTSTAMQINVAKSAAPDFYIMEGLSNSKQVFAVSGDGRAEARSLQVTESGATIVDGGFKVDEGGMTIANDGAFIYNEDADEPVLKLVPVSTSFANRALEMSGNVYTPANMYFIYTENKLAGDAAASPKFTVRGDGFTQVHDKGMTVTGGTTVFSGGVKVTGGATIRTGGVQVTGGSSVSNAGHTVTGGVSIVSEGLHVTGGATIRSGGLTVDQHGFRVTAGGATVSTGGFKVDSGGATVASGGLKVTSGVTVMSGGIVATGGATILNLGLLVTGGVTVNAGGMKVSNGLTVFDSGIRVTDGLTVSSSGIIATGGISVNNNGVRITGGLTVATSGVIVTGGITVNEVGIA
ncbi:unnamed protein product, partial [Symbiodinium microadriaticum]